MLSAINQYKLDTHIDDYPEDEFTPLSQESYDFFETFLGIKRQFEGEIFYYPENNTFMERKCPNSLVSAIDNIIYKLYYHFHNKDEGEFIVLRDIIFNYFLQFMPHDMLNNLEIQEVSPNFRLLMWRFDWGNLILELGPAFDTSYIITSKRVRHAKPLTSFRRL